MLSRGLGAQFAVATDRGVAPTPRDAIQDDDVAFYGVGVPCPKILLGSFFIMLTASRN